MTVEGESFVGGVVGSVIGGEVSQCYATGTVTGQSKVGGVVGYLAAQGENEGVVSDSYWDTDATIQSDAVGDIDESHGTAELQGDVQGLTTEAMRGESALKTMTTFDFENTWRTRPFGSPALQFEKRTVATYADGETGRIESEGVFTAIDDWRASRVEPALVFDTIDAWRSGEQVP